MLRSMYSAVSGMKGFQTKLDVIGNNIANVNTIGFKKSTINFQDLLTQNLSNSGVNPMQVGLGSTTAAITVQHTPGSSMTTGIGTDLSIVGEGFFTVQQDPNGGEQYLTRAGNFAINDEGFLVTQQGYYVMGIQDDGQGNVAVIPINVKQNTDGTPYESFTINRSGEVIGTFADGTDPVTIAEIGITTVDNPSGLRVYGGSLYEKTDQAGEDVFDTATVLNTEIGSGQLEMSNVDLTEEFTEMIVAQRGFQANSRTITTSDEILQEVVNLKR